jgi:hypothetical protein
MKKLLKEYFTVISYGMLIITILCMLFVSILSVVSYIYSGEFLSMEGSAQDFKAISFMLFVISNLMYISKKLERKS